MTLHKIIGTLGTGEFTQCEKDRLCIEWYETNKKILHKTTTAGRDIRLKLINEKQHLHQDAIVFWDERLLIVIEINPCPVLLVQPRTMYEMAAVVYEIGNKHLPLYYEDEQLLMPFEQPLFQTLSAAGYNPVRAERKLLHPFKTSVLPHGEKSNSLFACIMQLTAHD